jgi:hypothetical protein
MPAVRIQKDLVFPLSSFPMVTADKATEQYHSEKLILTQLRQGTQGPTTL